MRAARPPGPGRFLPDPERLYEVGRGGRPYTIHPDPPGAAAALERRARRWWVAAILVNAGTMGLAAAAALLAPRGVAALAGLLALAMAPLLLVPILLRRRGLRHVRHVHRRRPPDFPPPPG